MSDKDTWKLDKDSPVFNFFIEFIAYIIAASLVLVIGFVVAVVFKDFTHLGRAGAVVTLIAISMAYKDFYLDLRNMSFEETVKFLGKEKLFEIWASGFVHKKKDELESIKPGFNEKDAIEFLENLKDYESGELEGLDKEGFIKAWLKEMFDIWSKKLRGWEFTMLKTGTVLWAFSDLINIPFGW
ncbi:hypothetical protein ACIGBN_13820 [Marinomonas sp. NPDC078689]|uniref:hypothetical protein n=1 Tax=Marinomonas sp. NPDC078689 TaxID=3364147 RepID=UPI0037C987EC